MVLRGEIRVTEHSTLFSKEKKIKGIVEPFPSDERAKVIDPYGLSLKQTSHMVPIV